MRKVVGGPHYWGRQLFFCALQKTNRGAAPGSSLEFNAHGERAGWAHDVDAGSVVVVARRAVAGFVEGVLEIGQLSTPI